MVILVGSGCLVNGTKKAKFEINPFFGYTKYKVTSYNPPLIPMANPVPLPQFIPYPVVPSGIPPVAEAPSYGAPPMPYQPPEPNYNFQGQPNAY